MMRIGLLTSWLSHRSGGVHESVSRLALSLQADPGYRIAVFGLADRQVSGEEERRGQNVAGLTTYGPSSFGYAPGLFPALEAAELDLLHVHGLWMHYSVACRRWARATGRAYVISPHGMLDPWALRHSGWKKQLALLAYEREHLQKASCLHALCHAEADAMRQIGLRNPICIVPNSVDLPILEPGSTPAWRKQIPASAKILLYLGRLHAKKGLVNLLRAWESLPDKQTGHWHLVIVGWDQGGYEGELQQLVRQRGLDRVHFPGPLFGTDKRAAYAAADAFILPSVSEGLPLVVLEAWSHGVPVVMTHACNLPEGFAAGAALQIGPDIEGIRKGLDQVIHMSTEHRRAMGEVGRRLCRDRFSSMRVGEMMRGVYRWLLDSGPRPECVLVDTDSQSTGRDCLSVHSTGMARSVTD